jgi:hypothetical protein
MTLKAVSVVRVKRQENLPPLHLRLRLITQAGSSNSTIIWISLSEKNITIVTSRHRLPFACPTSTRSRTTKLKERRRETRGWRVAPSAYPTIHRISDSKMFIYVLRYKQKNPILFFSFEKLVIVSQPDVVWIELKPAAVNGSQQRGSWWLIEMHPATTRS